MTSLLASTHTQARTYIRVGRRCGAAKAFHSHHKLAMHARTHPIIPATRVASVNLLCARSFQWTHICRYARSTTEWLRTEAINGMIGWLDQFKITTLSHNIYHLPQYYNYNHLLKYTWPHQQIITTMIPQSSSTTSIVPTQAGPPAIFILV
jgi:hypothetical protein